MVQEKNALLFSDLSAEQRIALVDQVAFYPALACGSWLATLYTTQNRKMHGRTIRRKGLNTPAPMFVFAATLLCHLRVVDTVRRRSSEKCYLSMSTTPISRAPPVLASPRCPPSPQEQLAQWLASLCIARR